MKKILFAFIFFLLFISFKANTQNDVKDIIPFFSFSTFYAPGEGPYLETYLTIIGSSVYYKLNENKKYQGTIELTVIIKQNTNIKDYSKILIKTPEVEDTVNVNFSLTDVQRFLLQNGEYEVELVIRDINSPFDAFTINESFLIEFTDNKIHLSGIQLLEKIEKTSNTNVLTKSGFDLYPLPINFFPPGVNSLKFYSEIYNTEQIFGVGENFLLLTKIEHKETGNLANNLQRARRETAKKVNNFIQEFDITNLPSGNYNLVVEIRDKENKLVEKNSLFFQRSNPGVGNLSFESAEYKNSFVIHYTSTDTISEIIRSLRPISSVTERFFIDQNLERKTLSQLQQFLYTFWVSRSTDPLTALNDYIEKVNIVNSAFGTKIKKGYQSDRGRVYLQYGAPNSRIVRETEPNSYPYEIWHYYTLNNQRNRRFVFFNPSLATNDWELLHSDAFGEIQNSNWQVALQQRNFLEMKEVSTDRPRTNSRDWGWGSRAEDYWNNPR